MAQTYQVNYIVDVNATNALTAINQFKTALTSMDKATRPLVDLQNKVRGLVETMSALNRGKYTVKIDTRPATQKIGKLIRGLQMAKAEVQQLNAMGVTLGTTTQKGRTTARTATTTASTVTTGRRATTQATRTTPRTASTPRYTAPRVPGPTNLGYKLWGPTPLPNNGGMAIDMLKGMGIAYGIAGLGTMISNIVEQAAEYDNLMKTVENILKSHDTKADFSSRFNSMTHTIRNVGMETKFKVTEVADAAKFLAMAGLNTEAISQSIRPIADIALVGDTDLGQTADLVTNIMTAYNIAPGKMRNAADIMTNTFTMSNTTLTEIAEAYKYAASLLSAGGVSFEEATAAIGVLGDAGIKGSQAGTTLRTIMANVVNPTKKQSKAWDALGIQRTNSDGSHKDLLEIFKELNSKGLGVDDYYKLFHKTAASGAVALAQHVGKWEDVYLENFLAKGLSANLADEKKNTLQGLWAQLTSVFTDKGVTAFNGVQGQLRNLMTTAISWLKTDSATKAFQDISKSLMEFVHTIIDASKWFIWFFEHFGWAIKIWAKFQLMIWPVVKAVTAFRSVFLGLMGLRKVSFMIAGLTRSFVKLGGAVSAVTVGTAAKGGGAVSPFGFTAGLPGFAGLSHQQYVKAAKGLNLARPHASTSGYYLNKIDNLGREADVAAWNQGVYAARQAEDKAALARYRKDRKIYNRRVARAQFGNAVKGIGGMAVGGAALGYGMHKLTEEDSTGYGTAAGTFFSVAGAAAMVGGPWGWGIAAGAAIIGGIMSVLDSASKSNKIYGELSEFAKKNTIQNGIIAGSESQTMQYLEAQYTKYDDINKLIERRIELTAKLLGLQSGDDPLSASIGMYESLMTKYKDMWSGDRLDVFNEMYRDRFKTDKHLINYGGQYYLTTADQLTSKYVSNGDGTSRYVVTGKNGEEAIKAGNGTTNGLQAAFASMAATTEVIAPGGYYEKLIEGIRLNTVKHALKGSSIADFDNYMEQIERANNPKYLSNLVGLADIKDTDWNLERMLQDEQTRQYMWYQLNAILEPMREAFHNFRNEVGTGEMTVNTLANYLQSVIGNQAGLAIKTYDPNNVSAWYANYGFTNGTFTGYTHTDEKGMVHTYTAEEAAKIAASDMQAIIDAIKQSGAASEPAAESLLGFSNTLLTQAQAFMSTTDELINVAENQEITLNGQLYRWNEILQQYEAIDSNGNLMFIQSQVTGLGNSFNFLGQSLGMDWNSSFNGLFSGLNGTLNYLNMLGSIRFGTPYIPTPVGLGFTTFGNEVSIGTGTAATGFSLFGNSNSTLFGQSGSGLNYGFQNPLQSAWNRSFGGTKPLTLNLGQASSVVANGGGQANGWRSSVQGNADNTTNGTEHSGRTGTKSSDYKSSKKERAVPKQININIQNLMKVDSIDLTNPDNVAIIDRMKREVAYALYEAAGDGVMMLNGLATQNG